MVVVSWEVLGLHAIFGELWWKMACCFWHSPPPIGLIKLWYFMELSFCDWSTTFKTHRQVVLLLDCIFNVCGDGTSSMWRGWRAICGRFGIQSFFLWFWALTSALGTQTWRCPIFCVSRFWLIFLSGCWAVDGTSNGFVVVIVLVGAVGDDELATFGASYPLLSCVLASLLGSLVSSNFSKGTRSFSFFTTIFTASLCHLSVH